MNQKEELDAAHQHSLSALEAYMAKKNKAYPEAHDHVHKLKDEWKLAWNKLMEALLILEKLEI